MVDYSLVRHDCPFLSFFFVRLCGLLDSKGRRHPLVGLFVGRDCLFRFALVFLFPLVHRLVGFAQNLSRMFREEIQSSELEMGLSSFEQDEALEVSSSRVPFKALGVLCTLKDKDESRIRNRFQFSSSFKIRIPDIDDRACSYFPSKVCFYEVNFTSGLLFPIHPFTWELFLRLKLALAQLVPNLWRTIICCMVMWMSANEGDILRVEEFLHLYHLKRSKLPSYWEFKPWDKRSRLVIDSLSPLHEWKTSFFFVFGDGWETTPRENSNDISKFLHRLGTPKPGASFIFLLYICVHIYICSSFLNFAKEFFFTGSPCPRLKKRYHNRLEKVRGYIKSISHFNELISQ